MKRRRKLAVGVPVTAVIVLWGLGVSAEPGSRAPSASAATLAQAVVAADSAAKVPTLAGKPVFDATFHGTHLNTKIWDTCYPKLANYNGGCRNWGNPEEAEWYLPSQVKVSGGDVRLVAQRKRTVGTTSTGARQVYGCRSGMITSYPGFKFEYGFVQIVASIPHGRGLWPALWLAAANGQFPPEIDMVESWGVNVLTGSFYHPVTGTHSRATYPPKLTKGWQTYSLSWTRSKLKFWVGSKLVLTVTKNVPHQRMYLLADLAEYLPAKRGYCTGQLMIKSVKVWKS
jgi:beta-glucanase (GH16 family)